MANEIFRLNGVVRSIHLPELSIEQAGRPYAGEQALRGSDEGLSLLDEC